MKREDLEKLSKDELIDIILNMQDQLLALTAKLAELEARFGMNSRPPRKLLLIFKVYNAAN